MTDLSKIKMIIFDVDGVLTDGKIIYTNINDEIKFFDVKDGFALYMAKKMGYKLGIITGRDGNMIFKRAAELKFDELYMGRSNKLIPYEEIKLKHKLSDEEIAYMGDDLPDLPILKRCAFATCPSDAVNEVKAICQWQSTFLGGNGAVREMMEYIFKAQGRYNEFISDFLI